MNENQISKNAKQRAIQNLRTDRKLLTLRNAMKQPRRRRSIDKPKKLEIELLKI